MSKINKCQLCNNEVDIDNGGAAIMIAFCRNHSTNLTNISLCNSCYNALLVEWLGIDDEKEESE